MGYIYGSSAINFNMDGEYITMSSVDAGGIPVPNAQTLVLGTSVNNLPTPTEVSTVSSLDYMPLVDTEGGLSYKVSLNDLKTFFNAGSGMGLAPSGGISGNIFNDNIILANDKYCLWQGALDNYGVTVTPEGRISYRAISVTDPTVSLEKLAITVDNELVLISNNSIVAGSSTVEGGKVIYNGTNLLVSI